jgi:hypothetical protein
VNHKVWTVLAFLQAADGGLGLDVARDNRTLDAMKTALVKLVETDIQDLTGHRLEASDFHALLSPDPVRAMLAWMNDPKAAQAKVTVPQREAFGYSCKDKFGFHPMKDGPLQAAVLRLRLSGTAREPAMASNRWFCIPAHDAQESRCTDRTVRDELSIVNDTEHAIGRWQLPGRLGAPDSNHFRLKPPHPGRLRNPLHRLCSIRALIGSQDRQALPVPLE